MLAVTLPPGDVKFTFPTSEEDTTNGHIYLTIPRGSRFDTSLHWHATHTEYMKVIKGRALFTLDGVARVYTPDDDEIEIKPYVWHIVTRADAGRPEGVEGDTEDIVIQERTSPADREKEIFFRNAMSMLKDGGGMGPRLLIQALALMAETDMYPVVLQTGPRWLSRYVTYTLLWTGWLLAKALGLSVTYDEYTPSDLKAAVAERKKRA